MSGHNSSISNLKTPLVPPLLAELSAVLSVDFEWWEYTDRWSYDCHAGSESESSQLQTNSNELTAHLNKMTEETQPLVATFDQNKTLILIPTISEEHRQPNKRIAVGMVESVGYEVVNHLVNTSFRLQTEQQINEQSRVQLEKYAEQVSGDFEELFWLREPAQQLEYCGAENPIEEITEKVLPSLRHLIKANSLIYFPENRSDSSTESPLEQSAIVYGDRNVDLMICQDLVTKHRERALEQPVVNNYQYDSPVLMNSDLNNCFILVPVARGEYVFAWLLAIGKNCDILETLCDLQAPPVKCSEREFGTFEAGLMATTGILLANHAHNAQLFLEQQKFTVGVIRSLINSIDAKDHYTCGHSDRVALMAKRVSRQLGLDERFCEQIYMTGLLHDVGKIGIPDSVLCKNGALTDEEFDIIKQHPEIGYSILKHLKPLEYVLPGVLYHHERVDGKGYPHQLSGEEIPLEGRILAVVDAYDAMTSCRPYRSAMSFEKAESILLEHAGTQWDPAIVKAFFGALNDIHDICSRTESDTKKLLETDEKTSCAQQSLELDSIDSAVSLTHLR